jgi:oligopeptide/dipeptide ABC transporter ATP-binding protein
MSETLIETRGLKKYFKTPKGMLHAVDNINFKIKKGTTLGVVGESGCGKTTLGRLILRLINVTAGEVFYEGDNILQYTKKQMHTIRPKMQLIFQDPYSSVDPRKSVEELIGEPLKIYKNLDSYNDYRKKIDDLMATVGLAERYAGSYPHELDGGRRQRIGIARALALNPEFIVCDEPVSALDVSIQAQILNLLMDLQEEKGMAYMFITHNLSVVKHISHEIAVMYLGQCIEYSMTRELFKKPMHPYTQGLLDSVPVPSLTGRKLSQELMAGELTSPVEPKPGCRFAPRCPKACDKCSGQDIPLKEIDEGHFVACTLYG